MLCRVKYFGFVVKHRCSFKFQTSGGFLIVPVNLEEYPYQYRNQQNNEPCATCEFGNDKDEHHNECDNCAYARNSKLEHPMRVIGDLCFKPVGDFTCLEMTSTPETTCHPRLTDGKT